MQERICKHIAAGVPETTAALVNGIDDSTYFRWKAKGEPAKAPAFYRQFRERVKKALAEAESGCVITVRAAAAAYTDAAGHRHPGQWQAAAWWLERRLPDTWGKRERLEHGGVGGANEVIVKHVIVWEDRDARAAEDTGPLEVAATNGRLLE